MVRDIPSNVQIQPWVKIFTQSLDGSMGGGSEWGCPHLHNIFQGIVNIAYNILKWLTEPV